MANLQELSDRIDHLSSRFERIESKYFNDDKLSTSEHSCDHARYCAVPVRAPRTFSPEVSPDRASAIITFDKKWVNQTNLKFFLFDSGPYRGDTAQFDVVREAFQVWKRLGLGLTFTEVSSLSEAEIRIGFQRGDGSWSYIGRDALRIGQTERTMNFGWDITVSGSNGLDTAIHEIGHALGLEHEHQNPNAGIVWNREQVYEYFYRTQEPPWDRNKTDFNILNTIPPDTVRGTNWDPNSIMHYAFASGLISEPARYRTGLTPEGGLSPSDIEVIRRFYPPSNDSNTSQLKVRESQLLSLTAGEQKDYMFVVDETRDYEFMTFGESDTVMVLFEEDQNEFRYVKGDDDSGDERNAYFKVRLIQGRSYQLRIRLYFNSAIGDTAIMMS